jgi:hypothetical protein
MTLTTKFYWFAAIWLLALFAASIYSPPSFISDPGLGFLDLINFSEGGKFMHHQEPLAANPALCVETKTTWWSPGQWFFIYLFTLTGLPLGMAISVTVLIACWLGLNGWLKLYRRFQFSETVVLYAGLLILFSRYLFSSFQIYPGANILEFAAAPWMLLLWFELGKKSFWLQAACLLPLLIVSYFVKSSMLIFWLGVIGSSVSLFQLKQIPWLRLFFLMLVFVAGKYCCDLLFTSGGATPFSYPGKWLSLHGGSILLLLQQLLFTIAAPFLASIGADDYIRYVFQKPGSVIFESGHPAMLLIYGAAVAGFLLLIRYFLLKRKTIPVQYSNLLVAVTGVFIAFFLYSYLSGKNINGYEESRHMRLAGLLLLPLLVQWMHGLLKRWMLAVPVLMFGYAVMSSFSKLDRTKIISEKYRVPLGEINTKEDYQLFLSKAKESDLVYVIHADLKYDLDHCKTIYKQDDFISLELIKARTKVTISKKTIVFLLPERFAANGKRDAILANFPGADQALVETTISKLNNWELITVSYR